MLGTPGNPDESMGKQRFDLRTPERSERTADDLKTSIYRM
jgi:hypothetical protein